MGKRTPEEILKAIEESEIDDEMDRVLAMSDKERRRELATAGVDMDKLHAQADALHDQIQGVLTDEGAKALESQAGMPSLRPRDPRQRRRAVVWGSVALAAALLGVLFFANLLRPEAPVARPRPAPSPSTIPEAVDAGQDGAPR